jgi:hypothetical protein
LLRRRGWFLETASVQLKLSAQLALRAAECQKAFGENWVGKTKSPDARGVRA